MRRFQNILYVAHVNADGDDALRTALTEAGHNEAALRAVIICPSLPARFVDQEASYEAWIRARMSSVVAIAKASMGLLPSEVPMTVEVEWGDAPAVSIVRRVLRNAHDLLIKQAEPTDRRPGFRSFDMQLLRLCPTPVWLCRPSTRSRKEVEVAVAVNPQSQQQEAWDLGLQLLRLARSAANTRSGKLHIISCWEFLYAEDLRHSPWLKVSEESIREAEIIAEQRHKQAFKTLLHESAVAGDANVLLVRGKPERVIPRLVDDLGIDLLIMGTVARTGLQGFIIGNTAENALGEISCSLLAAKPNGFVSPVRAYD